MNAIANTLVALVAALHVYFLTLEMFFWTKPLGLRVFGNSPEKAAGSAVLAANQGLYNGFPHSGPDLGPATAEWGFRLSDQGIFSFMRDRGRPLWRGFRQPENSVRPGCAGGAGADLRLARLICSN
jgi:hypothetical protein